MRSVSIPIMLAIIVSGTGRLHGEATYARDHGETVSTASGATSGLPMSAYSDKLPPVFPGATWESRTPGAVGMDAGRLDAASEYLGGRGCIVRHGYVVYAWGDQAVRGDIASAAKPFYAHFLLQAIEDKRLSSMDEPVVHWAPCLEQINAALDYKDRRITFRHMANQTSCYGVTDWPGTAYD